MSTFMANKANIERKWYVVDAAGKPLGKTAVIVADLLQDKPELAMRVAVRGMMPRNIVTKDSLKRLHIYAGEQHDHAAQKPELVK